MTENSETMGENEPLLTAREVAAMLGATHDWVLDQWQAGNLPGFRLTGRMVRFRASEIASWLESRRRGPRPAPLARPKPRNGDAADAAAAAKHEPSDPDARVTPRPSEVRGDAAPVVAPPRASDRTAPTTPRGRFR